MRNKLTIGAFLLMLTAFIVVLALPADEESIKSENRVMATIPPVNEETVFSGEFETGDVYKRQILYILPLIKAIFNKKLEKHIKKAELIELIGFFYVFVIFSLYG